MNAPADPRAAPAIQRHLGTLIIISGFFGGIKFPLGLLTGLSGVGLLIRRRWCRLVAFVCLAGAILHDMTGRIFVAAILVPAANEFQKDLGRNGGFMHADAPIGSILIVQTVIGFIIAACVWAAFAVPVFLLLNSRSAKQYFAANRR